MTVKLSDRFAQLQNANANSADHSRGNRTQKRSGQQQDKRTAQTATRRGLAVPVPKVNKGNKKESSKTKTGNVKTGKCEIISIEEWCVTCRITAT
jgi:hypothetical protein